MNKTRIAQILAVFEQSIWATVEGLYIQNTPTTWFHLAREHDVNIEEKMSPNAQPWKSFVHSPVVSTALLRICQAISPNSTPFQSPVSESGFKGHTFWTFASKLVHPLWQNHGGPKWLVHKSALRFWIVNLINSPKIAQESAGFRTPQSAAVPWAFGFGWPAERNCRKPCNG